MSLIHFKKIIIKIDDKRECIEDFIADKLLAKLDKSGKIDFIEEKIVMLVCDVAQAYLKNYGVSEISTKVKREIAKQVVKGISKANRILQKQLKKKSKKYKERHKND